jgi:DNA-binding FrmR family transcriptional regulator
MMNENKIKNRLKAIIVQLQLVINAVENNRYCFYVVQQSMAVNGGLKKLNCRILQYHFKKLAFKNFDRDEQRKDFERLTGVIK